MSDIDKVAELAAAAAAANAELRRLSALYARRPGANIAGIARAAGVSRQTLYNWVKDLE